MTHTFLRLPEVSKRTGFKKTKIYKDIKAGSFPKPVPLSKNAVGWLESEIHRWQEERINQR